MDSTFNAESLNEALVDMVNILKPYRQHTSHMMYLWNVGIEVAPKKSTHFTTFIKAISNVISSEAFSLFTMDQHYQFNEHLTQSVIPFFFGNPPDEVLVQKFYSLLFKRKKV